MKTRLTSTLILALCAAAGAPSLAEPPAPGDDSSTLYALGQALAGNLQQFELTEAEVAHIQEGFADAMLGRDAKFALETYGPGIDPWLRARSMKLAEKLAAAGTEFRARAAEEPGAVKTDSGLVYKELEAGDGPSPGPTDTVRLHYHGTLIDGSVFDSSREGPDAAPAQFAMNGVVPCFSEGVGMMKVGGKSKLVCPPELAYGDAGRPGIPPGATLIFEVELLEVVGATPEPAP